MFRGKHLSGGLLPAPLPTLASPCLFSRQKHGLKRTSDGQCMVHNLKILKEPMVFKNMLLDAAEPHPSAAKRDDVSTILNNRLHHGAQPLCCELS